MKIRVLCSKEELEKTDEIQEALSRAMKPLTQLGFKGEITIEEAQGFKTDKKPKYQKCLSCMRFIDQKGACFVEDSCIELSLYRIASAGTTKKKEEHNEN